MPQANVPKASATVHTGPQARSARSYVGGGKQPTYSKVRPSDRKDEQPSDDRAHPIPAAGADVMLARIWRDQRRRRRLIRPTYPGRARALLHHAYNHQPAFDAYWATYDPQPLRAIACRRFETRWSSEPFGRKNAVISLQELVIEHLK